MKSSVKAKKSSPLKPKSASKTRSLSKGPEDKKKKPASPKKKKVSESPEPRGKKERSKSKSKGEKSASKSKGGKEDEKSKKKTPGKSSKKKAIETITSDEQNESNPTKAKYMDLKKQLQEREQAITMLENRIMGFNEDQTVSVRQQKGNISLNQNHPPISFTRSQPNGHAKRDSADLRSSEPASHRNSQSDKPVLKENQPFRGFEKNGAPAGLGTLEDDQDSLNGGIQMFDNNPGQGRHFMNQSMSEQSSKEVAELLRDSRRQMTQSFNPRDLNAGILPSELFEKQNQEIQNLSFQNSELKKKVIKYKKQIEVIPELKADLQNVKGTIQMVERGFGDADLYFESKRNGRGNQRANGTSNESNYALVKENVDLKGSICELKEHLLKKNHIIEGFNSEIKIMINDMKYMHQKLNHGEDVKDIKESEITSKYLVSQIDQLIEEKLHKIKDSYDRNQILEERVTGLKDQISNMQSIIDRNQEAFVQQSARLASYEDSNKNLKLELNIRQDSDKALDHFKQHARNHLLNIKHQIDAIQADHASLRRPNEQGVDQLFEYVGERAQSACLNERNLRSLVEQLQLEIQQKTTDTHNMQREHEEQRSQIVREEEEHRMKMQDHIRKLEEHLEKLKYDRSYIQIDSDAQIKAKEMKSMQYKEEGELLEVFLNETFSRLQVLSFQKLYLEVEARSATDSLNKVENELRRFIPTREKFLRRRPIKTLKKVVRAIIFASRIRHTSTYLHGEQYLKKRAVGRLLDNWIHSRNYWDSSIRQNSKLLAFSENLIQRLGRTPLKLSEIPRRHLNDERIEFVDALKVKIGETESQNNVLSLRVSDMKNHIEVQDRKLRQYEEDHHFKIISNDRLTQQMTQYQIAQREAESNKEELAVRLRGVIRDLESKMEEQVATYEQKLRYMKQELEMKRIQNDNMKRLIDFKDAGNRTTTNQQSTGADKSRNMPYRQDGGGYTHS